VHFTGGQVLGSVFGMPVVELHTVGRKSGQPRSTMLTAPVIEGDRVVLVASKGGDDRDPDWYRNLIAHPDIELTMAADAGRCGPARRRRRRRRSCGPGWWPPTPVTAVISAAPIATSRWSSASRADRPPRLALAAALRRFGRPALCLGVGSWRRARLVRRGGGRVPRCGRDRGNRPPVPDHADAQTVLLARFGCSA